MSRLNKPAVALPSIVRYKSLVSILGSDEISTPLYDHHHDLPKHIITPPVVSLAVKSVNGMKTCKLLAGQFAILIQFILAFICFLTLAIKWHYEKPRRSTMVWVLDGTKQGVGSMTGHLANIFLSTILAASLSSSSSDDECKWYLMNYLSDATLGILFNLSLLLSLNWFLHRQYDAQQLESYGLKFGSYGTPISSSVWLSQLLIWLIIILIGKLLTFSCFYLISTEVDLLLSSFFHLFDGYPKVELVMVMIIVPFLLNSFQFWIQDSFLMIHPTNSLATSGVDDDDEKVSGAPPSLSSLFTLHFVSLDLSSPSL
jgi:hypothetical protein